MAHEYGLDLKTILPLQAYASIYGRHTDAAGRRVRRKRLRYTTYGRSHALDYHYSSVC